MKDNLENFIQQHRPEFDAHDPPDRIWSQIDQELDGPRRAPRLPLWRGLAIAASIAALIAVGMAIGWQLNTGGVDNPQLAAEVREAEDFYQALIERKMQRLASYQYRSVVEEDLKELDDYMSELKIELTQVPPGEEEEIVGAIIKNYQARIEILERVLSRLEQEPLPAQKEHKNEEDISI